MIYGLDIVFANECTAGNLVEGENVPETELEKKIFMKF
jgi:hypothetical protein